EADPRRRPHHRAALRGAASPIRSGRRAMDLLRAVVTRCAVALVVASSPARADDNSGQIVVVTQPAGAEVSVDGKRVGVGPVVITSMKGDHFVQVRWPDGGTAEQTVTV